MIKTVLKSDFKILSCTCGPVVKTPGFQRKGGQVLTPSSGTKIPHALCGQKKKKNNNPKLSCCQKLVGDSRTHWKLS